MSQMDDVEIIGIAKSYTNKKLEDATISTVTVTQTITSGEELAKIDVSGTETEIYMPSVKVNGVAQSVASNELDLDVANNLITEEQWAQIDAVI